MFLSTASRTQRRRLIVPGNYSQWSPVWAGAAISFTPGFNNQRVTNTASTQTSVLSAAAHNGGKWYTEVTSGVFDSSQQAGIGVGTVNAGLTTFVGQNTQSWGLFVNYGFLFTNNANGPAISPTSVSAGDVVMIAYDGDKNYLWFGLNGTWLASGSPAAGTNPNFTGVTGPLFVMATPHDTSWTFDDFRYAVPQGFSAWGNVATNDRRSREMLTATREYFIRSDGSDINDGLSNVAGATGSGAFATLQKAYNMAANLDVQGFTVGLTCGTVTTWTAGINMLSSPVGGGNIVLNLGAGTISTTGSCITVGSIITTPFTINNGTLASSAGNGINMLYAGTVRTDASVGPLIFGACSGVHVNAQAPSALFLIEGNYNITGAATRHIDCLNQASCSGGGRTITMSGALAFGQFVRAVNMSLINLPVMTYTGGTITGMRWLVTSNSLIQTNGVGTASTYFPGSTDGVIQTSGVFA